jgi:hypothetical protein
MLPFSRVWIQSREQAPELLGKGKRVGEAHQAQLETRVRTGKDFFIFLALTH